MRKVISSEWGEDPERMLASIDPQPAAAASIGQVYRGETTAGLDVAIKVQYPGIAEAVESDMRNIRMLAEGFQLRAEDQVAAHFGVVKRLLADPVAGEE